MTLKDWPTGDLAMGYTIIQRHFLLNSPSNFFSVLRAMKRFLCHTDIVSHLAGNSRSIGLRIKERNK